jgi:hypothetical protein
VIEVGGGDGGGGGKGELLAQGGEVVGGGHHRFPKGLRLAAGCRRYLTWEHIKWKLTLPCKLWKLQSKPHAVDPKEDSREVGGVMCKTHERWEG